MRGLAAKIIDILPLKVTVLCGVILLPAVPAAASYLDELEQEAARSFETSPPTTRRAPTADTPPRASSVGVSDERVKADLDKEGFERALQSHFYGSYLFYSALSTSAQEAVYLEYTQNNDIEYLREVIKTKMR